ncbi:carbohydrate ABC transporter permease [Microbacterium sp. AK031]|uniref:carbohydrate ABC transporter permease n=1 Tax=Microbacterium sp. AK031 TaxID=2723076 RepID=UPI0021687F5F|nr:sugar ABC transporter permease [Microbacterium sp. AK031]
MMSTSQSPALAVAPSAGPETHGPALARSTRGGRRAPGGASRGITLSSYLFLAPYLLLVIGFGLVPAIYAVVISFSGPDGGFAGFDAYVQTFQDFRYADAFVNIGIYAFFFIAPSMIISIGIALLLQGRSARAGSGFRFAYYLPQALVGAAGVVVWIFMLNPATSPVGGLMNAFGLENIFQVLTPATVPPVLAMIAVWTSANAILLMYAALTSIPAEILEAARIDGAGSWTTAMQIKLPMLRKWIGYTLILNIAAATQLFVEPQILASATGGAIGDDFSPLQLTYTFAYTYGNFPAAAALSVQLLAIAGILAAVVLRKTDMFRVEI